MQLYDELEYRGLLKDVSNVDTLKQLLATPQTIYCGFDPSASSMHLGNFVMISLLMRLQQAGHRVIAVVGGATGMIGDPSGKNKERNLLNDIDLRANTNAIRGQLERFINLRDTSKGLLVNNYDWLSTLAMLDYLRDYGKFFTINYMLSKEVVSNRMEAGISYTEFSYMILQSIDFLTLYKRYGCRIQVGGSDQWGNLTSGLELIRKVSSDNEQLAVFTAPLVTTSDGRKFGKSEEGALFLDANQTSPYKLYQYFINTGDADAIRYLKVFTFLSKEDIEAIAEQHQQAPHLRLAQKRLAYEVVKTVHSEAAADEAVSMSDILFSGEIRRLSKSQLEDALGSLTVEVPPALSLVDLLIALRAATSKREAREFITGRSVSLNGEVITDVNMMVAGSNGLFNQYTVIRRGKKNYYLASHR
ncbi:MAG TPA: tyrosine--tRNA ligase [Bacilli bacterium]|nr:tyrosine--tRNA ligase [Bacilli bacterium]